MMSDYERAVEQFKMDCKEAKRKEKKTFALTVSKKRRQQDLIRQTNMKLRQLIHGVPMKGYAESIAIGTPGTIKQGQRVGMRLKVPVGSGATQKELDMMEWFEGAEDEFDYSLVRKEYKYHLNEPLTEKEYAYRLKEPLTEKEYAYRVESPAPSLREMATVSQPGSDYAKSYYGSDPFDGSVFSDMDSPVPSLNESDGVYGSEIDSAPPSVKEEFSRFGRQFVSLNKDLDADTITDEQYIAEHKSLTQRVEDSRRYHEGKFMEMSFERPSPGKVRAEPDKQPAGRIADLPRDDTVGQYVYSFTETPESPIGEFSYDVK